MSSLHNQDRSDWHRADIKAALEKKGYSLSRIAREYGYAKTTPYDVLRRPFPTMERIVANILGVSPSEIWPSRYRTHKHQERCYQK